MKIDDLSDHDLGRILFVSRIREAWGANADRRINGIGRWPSHPAGYSGNERPAEHELAMAQVKALRKAVRSS